MASDAREWDARYAGSDPWGSEPNRWIREHTESLTPGRALDVAAGDGRHALWLAARGWQVDAVDFSAVAVEHGREAGTRLPAGSGAVDWHVADATTFEPRPGGADLVVVAYLQLPTPQLARALTLSATALAPGGTFVLVGHDRTNLHDGVGGPRDPDVLTDLAAVEAVLVRSGLEVRLAEVARRPVDGSARPALDAVVVARRGPSSGLE
ncbi:bifunctional 2-polyprenyl-6-hydroxyphenol methylase/3-demethylubiquinol 3-O-methyltransferase UbiG [Cellulomonas sp. KRMCY2]|uniref:class I SAM-dependent methyltransferase n=1 Tax=Cellulomonas sp. KRMCY2 TaxID=1304865 RepID=UPI00045E9F9B|nr:class I SAM-dependent methyltransferase [Cellulomonas sp. KRMCY2]